MTPLCLGWQPDLPDGRDYTMEHPEVGKILAKSKGLQVAAAGLPSHVDLSASCSPVEDQGQLESCTSRTDVGRLEDFQRRAWGAVPRRLAAPSTPTMPGFLARR